MRPASSWSRASAALQPKTFRTTPNICVFCEHRPLVQRLAFSASATTQKIKATPLHQIDRAKTGGSGKAAPWLELQRRLRNARAEHQRLLTERNEDTLSEEDRAARRRNRKAAKQLRAAEAARLRQALEHNSEASDREHEIAKEENAYREFAPSEQLDVEPKESRLERRRRRKEDDNEALRQWQMSVDAALDKIPFPRPANWDGMEVIGGEKEIDTGLKYHGYLHPTKLKSKPEITAAVYRALVEILTAINHGENPSKLLTKSIPQAEIYHDVSTARITLETVESSTSTSTDLKVEYPDEDTESRILESLQEPERTIIEEETLPASDVQGPLAALESEDSIKTHIKAWGSDWYKISIENPQIKFPIIKRLTRLLGRPIPDSTLHSAKTISQLLAALCQPERPKKLYEILTRDVTALAGVPNVSLAPRRRTIVDKESALGRWKVIRSELRRKNLPVLRGVTGWEMESAEAMKAARLEAAELSE